MLCFYEDLELEGLLCTKLTVYQICIELAKSLRQCSHRLKNYTVFERSNFRGLLCPRSTLKNKFAILFQFSFI